MEITDDKRAQSARRRRVASGLLAGLVATAFLPAPALAEKRPTLEDRALPCPADAPVLVGSPSALRRYSALAGCADVQVIPELDPRTLAISEPGDYVIRATRRDKDGRLVDGDLFTVVSQSDGGDADDGSTGDVQVRGGYTSSGIRVTTITPVDEEDRDAAAAPSAPSAPVRWTEAPAGAGPAIAAAPALPAPVVATAERLLSLRPIARPTRFDEVIGEVARRQRVDALFLHAVIKNESAYRPAVVSHAGAVGMMQIMPGTGRDLGVARHHLTHPPTNIDAGARLIRRLAAKYNNDFRLVLAAYNAGEGAVAKYGNRIPPYRETQGYVRKVLQTYAQLCAENGIPVALN